MSNAQPAISSVGMIIFMARSLFVIGGEVIPPVLLLVNAVRIWKAIQRDVYSLGESLHVGVLCVDAL